MTEKLLTGTLSLNTTSHYLSRTTFSCQNVLNNRNEEESIYNIFKLMGKVLENSSRVIVY